MTILNHLSACGLEAIIEATAEAHDATIPGDLLTALAAAILDDVATADRRVRDYHVIIPDRDVSEAVRHLACTTSDPEALHIARRLAAYTGCDVDRINGDFLARIAPESMPFAAMGQVRAAE